MALQAAASQFTQTAPTILCCVCGVPISSNAANMCTACLQTQCDITEGIQKQSTIFFCKACGKYLNPPNAWLAYEAESKELLGFVVKKTKGLNKVKLVDASWVYTEPHSKRLKTKLTIQKEVFASVILQQSFIVEITVQHQMCSQCQRGQANDTCNWTAVVQLRQKVAHKKTFYFLEQLILKHNVHTLCIRITEQHGGLDFYFSTRSHALKFVEFLNVLIPIRYKTAEKLISADHNNNVYNYNYTFAVEIAPICKDDLLVLPPKVAASAGSINPPLVLCSKISSQLHFMQPQTLQSAEVLAATYWKAPWTSLASSKQMVEYTVLDITPNGRRVGKHVLADVTVAKTSDFGFNDTQYSLVTHLGALLQPGDFALGYDVRSLNFSGFVDEKTLRSAKFALPDVVLVKKSYRHLERKRRRNRVWRMKHLNTEMAIDDDSGTAAPLGGASTASRGSGGGGGGGRRGRGDGGGGGDAGALGGGGGGNAHSTAQADLDEFYNDVEEDEELQAQINLYRRPDADRILAARAARAQASTMTDDNVPGAGSIGGGGGAGGDDDDDDDGDDGDVPSVPLERLLDDLTLADRVPVGEAAAAPAAAMPTAPPTAAAPGGAVQMTAEQFAQLPPDQQQALAATLPPEQQALLAQQLALVMQQQQQQQQQQQ